MGARYRNSFHKPGYRTEYGPEFFETEAKPIRYRGFLIYKRHEDCFDIVKDGICIGMYAGLNGAKHAIETRFDMAPQHISDWAAIAKAEGGAQ